MNNKYIGSNFDDFLEEEGLLAEVEANAIKRVISYQIAELMKRHNLSKAAMARRMDTSRSAIDRLLDPQNESVTLQTLERAALIWEKGFKLILYNSFELDGFTNEAGTNSFLSHQNGG